MAGKFLSSSDDQIDLTPHSFLQFGSPHAVSAQAQFVSKVRQEVYVNIGYRLSAFGFLASAKPKINGNFGFKDQWLALQWIRDNIEAFGGCYQRLFKVKTQAHVTRTGDPEDITVTGLSAGKQMLLVTLFASSQ